MIIRKLEKKDAQQVAVLILQLTKNIVDPENLIATIEELTEPGNWQYFVVENNEKVIAYGGVGWYKTCAKKLVGWFEEITVDKEYRGNGVGKNLVETLVCFAKSKDIKVSKLTTGNPVARKIYESFGFREKEGEDYFVKYMD